VSAILDFGFWILDFAGTGGIAAKARDSETEHNCFLRRPKVALSLFRGSHCSSIQNLKSKIQNCRASTKDFLP